MLPAMTLITTTARELVPPPLPHPDDDRVTGWRDGRGRLAALSQLVAGEPWLHVLNVAAFRLDLPGCSVTAVVAPQAPPGAVEDEFRRTVVPVALQLQGWEVLHASAIRSADGVVAFCAPSETGKTTFAYGLRRRGYPLWADDALVLDVTPEAVQVQPLPFEVRLRAPSAAYFGHEQVAPTGGRVLRDGDELVGTLPLRAVCLLARGADDATPLVRVDESAPPQAVPGLLDHAIYFGFGDAARKRRMIESYLTLATLLPVYRVTFRSGLEALPAVLATLEERLAWRPPW